MSVASFPVMALENPFDAQIAEPAYQIDESESLSEGVLKAVAQTTGNEPVGWHGLEGLKPLYEVIDPDALNGLFPESGNDSVREGTVSFIYHGYHIAVTNAGGVYLEPVEDERPASTEIDRS